MASDHNVAAMGLVKGISSPIGLFGVSMFKCQGACIDFPAYAGAFLYHKKLKNRVLNTPPEN